MHQPPYTWRDFPLAAPPDPRALAVAPAPVTVHHSGRCFERIGDSGWHMVVCWYAGPDHAVRVRDQPDWHTVRTRFAAPSGGDRTHAAPRTTDDQDIIEEAANSYLAEAEIPPRPRGFTWFLEVPEHRPLTALWQDISQRERRLATRAPGADEIAAAIAPAVTRFYDPDTSTGLDSGPL